MSCKSDGGFAELLPAGIYTGWTRRGGLTGVLLLWGGGGTKVRMGVGVLRYNMFSVGCSSGLTVVGGLASLFLFLGGGKANISGSIGPKSDSGGSLQMERRVFPVSAWTQYPNKCHICCFESKDVPTQMTKQSFSIIYFITFKKTIHFKLICKNVHS